MHASQAWESMHTSRHFRIVRSEKNKMRKAMNDVLIIDDGCFE